MINNQIEKCQSTTYGLVDQNQFHVIIKNKLNCIICNSNDFCYHQPMHDNRFSSYECIKCHKCIHYYESYNDIAHYYKTELILNNLLFIQWYDSISTFKMYSLSSENIFSKYIGEFSLKKFSASSFKEAAFKYIKYSPLF